MRILVTGGAGFIGSAAAARFVADGHEVVIIDSFNQYYDVALKRDRIAALVPSVPVYEVDITDRTAVAKVCATHQFDVVAHFAAQAGVRYSVEAPEVYITSNILGTQTIFDVMREYAIKRMVFASTSSIYGTTTPLPFVETAAGDRPVSMYAATKRSAELIAHTYFVQYGIETTCLRFFTVYGPWSRPDMAMLKFAQRIVAGEAIDIYNHGELRRDFTYIDDIVDGFARAIETPLGYEIINLGNGHPVELLRFIALLETALGSTATKRMLPMQQGDVFETFADTRKAQTLLGFTANVSFEEGVTRFVDWFREYYE